MQMPIRKKHGWLLAVLLVVVALAGMGGGAWLLAERAANPPDGPTPIVHIPQIPLPSPNAFDYDKKAAEALVDSRKIMDAMVAGDPSFPNIQPLTVAQKEGLVQENTKSIQLIHVGFAYPYVCRQDYPGQLYFFLYSWYSNIRAAADLFKLDGQAKASQGNWQGAVEADLDAVQLGEDLPHGAATLGWLLGLACQSKGRLPIWEVIPHLTSVQAQTAAQRLEAIDAQHTPFVLVMQEQEWTGQRALIAEFHKPHWRQALLDDDFREIGMIDSEGSRNVHDLMEAALLQSTKQSVYDEYTRYWEEFVRNARAPYAAHVPIPWTPPDPIDEIALFAHLEDKLFLSFYWRDCTSEAQNRLLMTALALRAYQLDHGALPASLSALVPQYLHAVPTDPFALSGPLRYHVQGDKYVLYSVGPDGKDDGGKPIFDPSKPAPQYPGASNQRYLVVESSKGDIVEGINFG